MPLMLCADLGIHCWWLLLRRKLLGLALWEKLNTHSCCMHACHCHYKGAEDNDIYCGCCLQLRDTTAPSQFNIFININLASYFEPLMAVTADSSDAMVVTSGDAEQRQLPLLQFAPLSMVVSSTGSCHAWLPLFFLP